MKGEINQDGSGFRDWILLSKGCQLYYLELARR
jgi:hypothetical protein